VPITNAGKQKADPPSLAYDRNDHPSSTSPFTPLRAIIWYSVWHRIQGGAESEVSRQAEEERQEKGRRGNAFHILLHLSPGLSSSPTTLTMHRLVP